MNSGNVKLQPAEDRPTGQVRYSGRLLGWRQFLPLILALLPTLLYGFCGMVAFLHYPGLYTPLDNTLSELGNPQLNPGGSTFYRVGCVLGGTATIAFFLTLGPWRVTGTKLQNRLVTVMQLSGVVAGLAMISFAIFANNVQLPHRVDLGVLAGSSLIAAVVSLVALRRPSHPARIRVATTVAVIAAVLLMFAISQHHWGEWLPAILAQAFLVAIGLDTVHEIQRSVGTAQGV